MPKISHRINVLVTRIGVVTKSAKRMAVSSIMRRAFGMCIGDRSLLFPIV